MENDEKRLKWSSISTFHSKFRLNILLSAENVCWDQLLVHKIEQNSDSITVKLRLQALLLVSVLSVSDTVLSWEMRIWGWKHAENVIILWPSIGPSILAIWPSNAVYFGLKLPSIAPVPAIFMLAGCCSLPILQVLWISQAVQQVDSCSPFSYTVSRYQRIELEMWYVDVIPETIRHILYAVCTLRYNTYTVYEGSMVLCI
jgi:hypothetical protein